MKNGEAQLGTEVRDRITGFTGIVVAITAWLNGCERVTVQPRQLKDGKRVDSDTFDATDLELESAGLTWPQVNETPKGGPCDDRAALRR